MLTPASGIVRANPEHVCTGCGRDLHNLTRYPGPVQFRCINRACGQSCLPSVMRQPALVPTGATLGHWA